MSETPIDPQVIQLALDELDHENDDHWTAGGLPAVEAVARAAGENVTRAQITNAAPDFRRRTAEAEEPAEGDENAALEAAEAEEREARAALDAARDRYNEATKKADALRVDHFKTPAQQRNEHRDRIRAFIERSNQERAERAEMARMQRELGRPTTPQSKLDQALSARKRQAPPLKRPEPEV